MRSILIIIVFMILSCNGVTVKEIDQIKRSDRIMFTNIVTKSIYNHPETVNSIEFYVK